MKKTYKFDRYKNGNKMAQGCLTFADSAEEAIENAARLYAAEGGKQVLVLTDTDELTADRDRLRDEVQALSQKWLNKEAECNELLAIKSERDRLRAELEAAVKDRASLATLIFNAHVRAFGSRHYEYVDPATTCDLLVADILATQHERDSATARAEAAEAALAELREVGRAVVDRWDSPKWKDQPHTAEFINKLRAAIDAARKEPKP